MNALLERMHPRSCLAAGDLRSSPTDAQQRLHSTAAKLLRDIDVHGRTRPVPRTCVVCSATATTTTTGTITVSNSEENNGCQCNLAVPAKKNAEKKSVLRKRRLEATKKLYKLSNDEENRVPLLCTQRLDVLATLIGILHHEDYGENDDDYVERPPPTSNAYATACTFSPTALELEEDLLLEVESSSRCQYYDVPVSSSPTTTTAGSGNKMATSSTPRAKKKTPPHEEDVEARRLACLILNNLSVPIENKAIMALGYHSTALLTTLLENIESASPESHLCIICLYNLSYLDDAADVLVNFCPPTSNVSSSAVPSPSLAAPMTGSTPPVQPQSRKGSSPIMHHMKGSAAIQAQSQHPALLNSHSVLLVLESLVRTYSPFLKSAVVSVESEAIRWTVGIMRNFAMKERHAQVICQTRLPYFIVQNLRTTTPREMNLWTENSMEELSLCFLCNMIKFDGPRDCLRRLGTLASVDPIIGEGGIHDFRAGLIHCALVEDDDDNAENKG